MPDRIRVKEKKILKNEKLILWISFIAGLGFAVVELISAIYTHSQSVLMDAAYDASELIIIILTLFVTPLFHKPISEKHPYGYAQLESIFIIVKSFMMMSVTLALTVNSINIALSGGNHVDGTQISRLQLVLGFACLVIYLLMRYLNKTVSSPTVQTELLGWKLDVGYSLGMSLAFYLSTFLEKTPLRGIAPYFDQIIAILIVLSILPENIKLLIRAVQDVVLFAPDESVTNDVQEICTEVLAPYHFEPVFYDITRTGRRYWVSVYFRIKGDTLKLDKLDAATVELETRLIARLENCSADLIVVSGITEKQMLRAHKFEPLPAPEEELTNEVR